MGQRPAARREGSSCLEGRPAQQARAPRQAEFLELGRCEPAVCKRAQVFAGVDGEKLTERCGGDRNDLDRGAFRKEQGLCFGELFHRERMARWQREEVIRMVEAAEAAAHPARLPG